MFLWPPSLHLVFSTFLVKKLNKDIDACYQITADMILEEIVKYKTNKFSLQSNCIFIFFHSKVILTTLNNGMPTK